MENPATKKVLLLTFVLASLLTAALWIVLSLLGDRLISHSGRSLRSLIPTALVFGVGLQLFNVWTNRRKRSGKSLISPYLMIALGLGGLALFVWLGWFYDQSPKGGELFWLIVMLLPPIYLLVTGGRMIWRQRAQGHSSTEDQA